MAKEEANGVLTEMDRRSDHLVTPLEHAFTQYVIMDVNAIATTRGDMTITVTITIVVLTIAITVVQAT